MKIKDPQLYCQIKNFLTVYLTDIQQKSVHTVQAYRDAINLYMEFLDKKRSIPLEDVCISDFNQENISDFLKWLHEEHGNKSSTMQILLERYAYSENSGTSILI